MCKINISNYTAKKLLVFPLMTVIFVIILLGILNYVIHNYKEWHTISSDILWATSNERPEEIKPEQPPSIPSTSAVDKARSLELAKDLGLPENFVVQNPWATQTTPDASSNDMLTKWVKEDRKQSILKWDAINANLALAKEQELHLLFKTIISAIAGLITALYTNWLLYKTCRFSIPIAAKKTKQAIIQSATTPAKRIGILLLPLSCVLFLCGILCWSNSRASLFDMDYLHGTLSFSGAMLFFTGVVLASGMAERLARWVKHGN